MGLIKSMADIMAKEIGNKSREFYEFVLPPVDMELHKNKITVTIDLPGFDKKDVSLRLDGNVLCINAQKPETDVNLICSQRPRVIDKKIRLPADIKAESESARLADGVLTVVIPLVQDGKDIAIE